MSKTPIRKHRCAVYTRKSSEEGLEQEFNSLDAQREACEAYIASQKPEGWVAMDERYDDGGISGATLERPALERLLADIEAGRIDIVVVYKIDRLSRSLMDFAKLIGVFETHGVTFVSITQQFNTTTPMGRLILNILLSFAQFEREVTAERIRDKVAASRKKGMWMGGRPPLGYDVVKRKLVVNAGETALVREIFERFIARGSATVLVKELAAEGRTTKSWVTAAGRHHPGRPFDKGVLYRLLHNRVYLGEAVHKGTAYPGEHEAIVPRALWDKVHAIFTENGRARTNRTRAQTPALLKGLLRCAACGGAMTPTHTRRHGRLYRYYVCSKRTKGGISDCPVRSIAASEIEGLVTDQVRGLLQAPEIAARTLAACGAAGGANAAANEREATDALGRLDEVWEELFPAEQARITRLLVAGVAVAPDAVDVQLRLAGLHGLIGELLPEPVGETAEGDPSNLEAVA